MSLRARRISASREAVEPHGPFRCWSHRNSGKSRRSIASVSSVQTIRADRHFIGRGRERAQHGAECARRSSRRFSRGDHHGAGERRRGYHDGEIQFAPKRADEPAVAPFGENAAAPVPQHAHRERRGWRWFAEQPCADVFKISSARGFSRAAVPAVQEWRGLRGRCGR